MDMPEHFQIAETHAVYRPEGCVSFQEGIELVSSAFVFSRETGIQRLLIDLRGLTGFGLIGPVERFSFGEEMARAAMAAVKVVFVARPEILDPDRFGVIVARNRGLFSNAFDSEAEALKWLLDPNAA
ncbi:MAG: hypothetical protein ACHQPI_06260 [Thermoanaerobaculia bacterium]